MKKRISIIVLLTVVFVSACSDKKITEKDRTDSESIVNKNELENLGLTYKQSLAFDSYVSSVSENINELQKFNNRILNEYKEMSDTDNTDILITSNLIETAYLDNGGINQNEVVDYLHESPLSFFQISKNMYENEREYTETEAYGCLLSLTSLIDEFENVTNLDKEAIYKLKVYFLNNIEVKGNFVNAKDAVEEKVNTNK